MATTTEKIEQPAAHAPKPKRGRPRKSTAQSDASVSALTRTTTRRVRKPKTIPAAPKPVSTLNRFVNIAVVAAVFITALAIQRIVPTAPVTEPKIETLAATPSPATAPEPAPTAVPAPVPAATPATSATQVAKKIVHKKPAQSREQDMTTPFNAGGAQDLDSESTRQQYLKTTKLATRAPAPQK